MTLRIFLGRMVFRGSRGTWGLGPCPLRAEWPVVFLGGLRWHQTHLYSLLFPSKVSCKSGSILGFQLLMILDF